MEKSQKFAISIPDDVRFEDLELLRDPHTGNLSFRWEPIGRICAASHVDISLMREGPEDNVAELLIAWYAHHLSNGGDRNTVMDELTREELGGG